MSLPESSVKFSIFMIGVFRSASFLGAMNPSPSDQVLAPLAR